MSAVDDIKNALTGYTAAAFAAAHLKPGTMLIKLGTDGSQTRLKLGTNNTLEEMPLLGGNGWSGKWTLIDGNLHLNIGDWEVKIEPKVDSFGAHPGTGMHEGKPYGKYRVYFVKS